MLNRVLGFERGETVGMALVRYRGNGPGFDLLRIVLALYIFYGHALWIAGGADAMGVAATTALPGTHATAAAGFSGWTRPFHVAAVPVFFALSGFLVSGSAIRLRSVSTFLAFRCLRILPALTIEVALCAVVLGPILTTRPAADYFSDPQFLRYFGNILGFITFHLPGLFMTNPVQGTVNANLWTLPAEFYCYAITAALMVTPLFFNRRFYGGVFWLVTIALIFTSIRWGFAITEGVPSPYLVTYYFFVGVFFYQYAGKIPLDWRVFILAAVAGFILLMTKDYVFLAPFCVTYCTVFVGLSKVPKVPLLQSGDYSYGIYLYGFPITQALVDIAPNVFVGRGYALLAVSTLITFAFAVISWHVFEKRCLSLKSQLPPSIFPVPAKTVPDKAFRSSS